VLPGHQSASSSSGSFATFTAMLACLAGVDVDERVSVRVLDDIAAGARLGRTKGTASGGPSKSSGAIMRTQHI